eukprot:TRINITY_DN72149_c0_g1_i1.p1 TRINITY_DN72149_c0_g1~~TRINITY_DN72149_c0_g1_i1.p1  ORF type:complete len:1147 (+),score=299.97 TRINITY_DN72149_c0_g1_i1:25-3465(+)
MAGQLAGLCELLKALVGSDSDARKAAEQKFEEARNGAPNQLVAELTGVLAASSEPWASLELRQEAVVLLRQCCQGKRSVWSDLDSNVRNQLKNQLLATLQQDPSNPVRRGAGSAIAGIVESCAEDFSQLMTEWPELLNALSTIVGGQGDAGQVTACLGVLKELVPITGEELLKKPQTTALLQNCLSSSSAEARSACTQLILQMVEDLEEEAVAPLGPLMPAVVMIMKDFAAANDQEEQLKEILESLISAVDEEPEFFKKHGLQDLWTLLLEMCKSQHWADTDVRHSAMEAAMSVAEGLCEDFCANKEGQASMEQLVVLNIEWMLDVEEDVERWTSKADETEDDYEIDGDTVEIGEENMDRLAEQCCEKDQMEDVFLPLLFKVIRQALGATNSTWRHIRSCVMAVNQVVEYIEEESWIDHCITFLVPHLSHEHPRVRFSAFSAVAQAAYDHDEYVAQNHSEQLLPAILKGLDDPNVRVATAAASALSSLAEEMDEDDLEPHIEELMTKLFTRLKLGPARTLQEACLSAIAALAEAAEELFAPYYSHVAPVLKEIIRTATSEDKKMLRCKAFECASLVGSAVGKEIFLADAHEMMQTLVTCFQAGFAPDDQTREYMHEAAGRVAAVLEKDFKPYMPALLPGIMKSLQQKPDEVEAGKDVDEDGNELQVAEVAGKTLGMKTSAVEEMSESLTLLSQLLDSLEDASVEFLPGICGSLMPLLEFPLDGKLQQSAFECWQQIIHCAWSAANAGSCDKSVVGQLLGEFLKATVGMMNKFPTTEEEQDSQQLQQLMLQSNAVSDVLRKSGKGFLAKTDIADLVKVLVMLLDRISLSEGEEVQALPKRRRKGQEAQSAADSDDEESDDEDFEATRQTVRCSLVDVAGALMAAGRAEFVEVGLPTFMELVKRILPDPSEGKRSLALYIADEVVDGLGELSVPYWDVFMESACNSITDKCAAVRLYAALTIGHASLQPIFGKIAPVAASQVARVLQKHGEKHRRRRAVNSDSKQTAQATDAAIWALGMICEHQEANVGGDTASAWRMWLTNMPLRRDREIAQKASHQLLELVVRNHPIVASPEQLPTVLGVFADVYKTRFSNPILDKEIAAAIARAGAEPVKRFAAALPERQRKKVDSILKDGSGESNKQTDADDMG